MWYHAQIRPKFSKILKKGQKAKQNICCQTTSENGKIFTIWQQKIQVLNPGFTCHLSLFAMMH